MEGEQDCLGRLVVASNHNQQLLALNLTRLGSSLASHFFPLSLTKTEIDFCRFPQFRLDLHM